MSCYIQKHMSRYSQKCKFGIKCNKPTGTCKYQHIIENCKYGLRCKFGLNCKNKHTVIEIDNFTVEKLIDDHFIEKKNNIKNEEERMTDLEQLIQQDELNKAELDKNYIPYIIDYEYEHADMELPITSEFYEI